MCCSIVASLLVVAATGVLSPVAAAADPPARPSLVVYIAVDQLRPEYLDDYAAQFTGGFARLLRDGAFFPNGFQDHGVTETAPGHASMLSGRFPRSTGIIANDAGVNDPASPLVDATGDPASPTRFRGTVLLDWMQARDSATRSLSVSRKDRGAILPFGRVRAPVYWYAASIGGFTTSRWYADTLPTWVREFNARRIPHSYAGKWWELLLPESAYQEPDSVKMESGGHDYVFPHPFPADPDATARSFAEYPMMDELTAQFALRGVSVLGLGAVPTRTDLLAVSFSSTDAVGHRFGPDSREIHDQIVRLDRTLGAFIDSLYVLRDSTTIVLALSSDHGVAPFPDAEVKSRFRKGRAGRVDIAPVVREVYNGLARAGVDTSAYSWDAGILSLDRHALARARVNADSVARFFRRKVSRLKGVERVDLYRDLARRDTTRDVIARRWLHEIPPDFPAAVVVTLKPFWTWEWDGVYTANHGSPHDYDARVPILFLGGGVRPGRYNDTVRVVDIAPTLATLIGVEPAERLDGVVLNRIVR